MGVLREKYSRNGNIPHGATDIAITKVSNSGTYLWTKIIGSTCDDYTGYGADLGWGPISANSISITLDGRIFVSGTFTDTVDFSLLDTGEENRTAVNGSDCFILELDASNGQFLKVKTYNLLVGTSMDLAVTVGNKSSAGQKMWVYFD